MKTEDDPARDDTLATLNQLVELSDNALKCEWYFWPAIITQIVERNAGEIRTNDKQPLFSVAKVSFVLSDVKV